MILLDDTIAALATAPGGAARGVVRATGPAALACVQTCFRADEEIPTAHAPAAVWPGALWLAGFASPVPGDLYWWPGQRSYTRQSVAELHLPGSPPLLAAALQAICRAGARPARPGEFTLRAFLAGRLDLMQAEGVLGAIDAASDSSLQAALGQMAGGLSRPLAELRNRLLDLLAQLEAGLDFVEEDIEFIAAAELCERLAAAEQEVGRLIGRMTRRHAQSVRRAALLGAPNVGKSSLFNALAGRERAIVSEQAGSTRDFLATTLDLDGVQVTLLDTAGVDDTATRDDVAGQAQSLTRREERQADVRLFCLDATRPLNSWEQAELAREDPRRLTVVAKTDAQRVFPSLPGEIPVSSATGAGLHVLKRLLRGALGSADDEGTEIVAATAIRCHDSLLRAHACLGDARALAATSTSHELVAAEVRMALDELGQVLGVVYTDDILDRVFSRFCIGK